MVYAGLWSRFYAYMLDQSIIMLLAAGAVYPVWQQKLGGQELAPDVLLQLLIDMLPIFTAAQVGIGVLYGAVFEASKKGATPGKMYCGLRVVTDEGKKAGFFAAIARNIGINLINALMYLNMMMALLVTPAYLTPLILPKKKALYDLAAGLVVVNAKSSSSSPSPQ